MKASPDNGNPSGEDATPASAIEKQQLGKEQEKEGTKDAGKSVENASKSGDIDLGPAGRKLQSSESSPTDDGKPSDDAKGSDADFSPSENMSESNDEDIRKVLEQA